MNLNDIYTIKISNGDELIAKVIETSETTITIRSPLTVLPSSQGIQLVPSLFTANPDDLVTINTSNISMYAPCRDEVRDSYVEATSGIKPVRKSILTG
jgi:hypothetical protein